MENGVWLPILEYARYKKISISTIRRYIKAGRVKHKSENGRYFIFVQNFQDPKQKADELALHLRLENERLQRKILEYQEEIAELKMLAKLYEGKMGKIEITTQVERNDNLPELPV